MAKTINQKEVIKLSASLPEITPKEYQEALRSYALIYVGKRQAWCTCCGEQWESDLWDNRRIRKAQCPHCGATAMVSRKPNKRVFNEKWYFSLVRVCQGWQVVRNCFCEMYVQKGGSYRLFSCNEVSQVWMKPDCPPVCMGRSVMGATGACDRWRMDTPITLKYDHWRYRLCGDYSEDVQLLPIVKRNGLKKLRRNLDVIEQIYSVMTDPRAEILAKGKQWNMFGYYCINPYVTREYWDSIRVAMRHRYIIRDAGLWLDYMSELRCQGKDIRNPKFICPDNLRKSHDEIFLAKRIKREKMEAERRRIEMEAVAKLSIKMTSAYRLRLKDLLDVEVKNGKIVLRPLQDLYDFYQEGEELHHCVYRNAYYNKEGVVIIGARVKGKRTETIELDLKSGKIIQCRGKFNKNSPFHKEIYDLMEKNISKYIKAI